MHANAYVGPTRAYTHAWKCAQACDLFLIGYRLVGVHTGLPHTSDARTSKPRTFHGQVNNFAHITISALISGLWKTEVSEGDISTVMVPFLMTKSFTSWLFFEGSIFRPKGSVVSMMKIMQFLTSADGKNFLFLAYEYNLNRVWHLG